MAPLKTSIARCSRITGCHNCNKLPSHWAPRSLADGGRFCPIAGYQRHHAIKGGTFHNAELRQWAIEFREEFQALPKCHRQSTLGLFPFGSQTCSECGLSFTPAHITQVPFALRVWPANLPPPEVFANSKTVQQFTEEHVRQFWKMRPTGGSDPIDSVTPRDNNSSCVLCI